ncbi:variant 7, Mitochondrial uncoupling protein 1 [Lathyrus oleraceus]|uniref:Variant 7, Mitochondrial uncoupling protein 1 n=1 Tax=Pisum sativum TaxID=3888 RepID=A0A9D5ANI5_PEA|nr:variant 7, Mitochondrial uncoupling protein 1 [Pisum sativum]
MVGGGGSNSDISFAGTFASSAFSACFAEVLLAIAVANPTDLVKVRLQAEGKLPPGALFWSLLSICGAAVAIAVANPTDLVKVRLQAEGKLPPGVPRRYTGSLNAYSTIH